MEEWKVIFCSNIRFLRKNSGMSQKKMAKIMGISISSLRKIEHGIIPGISWEVLLRLRNYFQLPLEQITEKYIEK